MKAFGNFSRETKKAINEGEQNIQSNDYHRSLCEKLDAATQKKGRDDQSKRNEPSGEQTRDQINTFVRNQSVKLNKSLKEMEDAVNLASQSSKISNSDAKATLENILQLYRQSKELIQDLQKFDMEILKADLIKVGDNILDKYFTGKFLSRLQEKHIAVTPDLLAASIDRHMDIKEVGSKCGDEAARIFAALKGEIVMIKSERMSYNENIAKKFKDDYSGIYNENKLEKGKFEVNIKIKASGKEEFYGTVYLNNQAIGVERSNRINDKSLQFSQLLGEILKGLPWKDLADRFIKQVDRNQIENNETRATIHLFIKGAKAKCKKETEKLAEEDFAIAKGLIEEEGIEIHEVKYEALKRIVGTFKVNKIGTDAYLAILGTPNGRSQQYLLKEYKQYLGNREITNIEVKYEFEDGKLFIGKIRFHINEVAN